MEKTKSVIIYTPDGKFDRYKVGESPLGRGKVKDIHLLNCGVIAVIYEDRSESVYANMLFIFNH